MKTLLNLFDENREQLKQRIKEAPNPENVVREGKNFLDYILAKYQQEAERNPIQRGLAAFLIDVLKSSMSILVAASEVEIWYREKSVTTDRSDSHAVRPTFWWRIAQAIVILSLLVMFWLNQNLIYLALLAILIVVEIGRSLIIKMRGKSISTTSESSTSSETIPTIQTKVQVKVDTYLAKLADALLTADKLLAEVLTIKTHSEKGTALESDSALLELFQDFLEARQAKDAEFALKQVRTIPFILERHGITVENYRDDNGHLFEFVPSLNPNDKTHQTLRPALVKDKRPLKRGLVAEPMSE